jgi:hypothetical protein
MARGGHELRIVSPGPPCSTFLRPAGGPPLKRPYSPFRGGPPTGRSACSRLLPFGHPKPYTYELSSDLFDEFDNILVAPVPVRTLAVGHDLPHDDAVGPDVGRRRETPGGHNWNTILNLHKGDSMIRGTLNGQ